MFHPQSGGVVVMIAITDPPNNVITHSKSVRPTSRIMVYSYPIYGKQNIVTVKKKKASFFVFLYSLAIESNSNSAVVEVLRRSILRYVLCSAALTL